MSPIERMKKLVEYLPDKDIKLGKKFIEERRFSDLKDLVDSILYVKKKSIKSTECLEEDEEDYDSYIEDYEKPIKEVEITIDEEYNYLRSLKIEVDNYCLLLGIEEEESEIEEYLKDVY